MIKNLKNIHEFVFDQEHTIYTHPDSCTIDYQDGGEAYILESMKKVKDLSSHSHEFNQYIKDWPSRYHFSNKRINFLESLKDVLPKNADVLEIGSGCGTITRWLGEQYHSVDALEGNAQRAGITRYRTKDLDNVQVYCGNLLATGFDKKYDVITLIGSLEYIPLYDTEHDDSKEACTALLTRLRGALKENGILLVAIENKFGAKYFSGCKEDHTGKEFEGIIGYPEKTPVTFTRNKIESIISNSGFIYNQFYHVFPDYKLTETIIPENSETLSLYPQNWIRTPFEDYSGKRLNLFPDTLFITSIVDSGLMWQFSNSFVIVAAKSENINLSVDWLIKKYTNNDFVSKFYHDITLIKKFSSTPTEKKYIVKRSPVFGALPIEDNEKFGYKLNDGDLIFGRLLSYDLFTALFKKSPEHNLKQILKRLHDELLHTYSLGKNDPDGYPLVNGEAIDYTFWNIIVTSENTLTLIDKKWRSKDPLTSDFILFRNLFNIFEKISPFLKNKNKKSFIIEMIQDIYPNYSEERLTANLQFERVFLSFVLGQEQNFTVDSLVQYSVNEQVHQNQDISAQVTNLNQALTVKNQQIQDISIQVNNLTQTLAVKDQQIQEISAQVTNLNQTLADKDQKIQEAFQKIIPLEQELSQIKYSIIWRTTMKYQIKVVDRLLKHGTRRREMYDLGLLSLHTIIDEGFRSFFWKQRKYRSKKTLYSIPKGIEQLPVSSAALDTDSIEPISKKVSIIIPTKNAGCDFSYTLEKIKDQKGITDIEIIIVDSGSSDNTLTLAEKYGVKITNVAPEDFSHGETRNLAASKSDGEYLVFIVQDAIPIGEHWLYNMVKVLEGDEKIAAVSCRQVPRSDADLFACFCIWYHYSVTMNLQSDIIYSGDPTFKLLPIEEKRRRAGLEDVSCCVKKDIFDKYHFKRVQSSEDLDLGFRLMQDGYKTAFMFSNGVIHSHNRDPNYFFKRSYVDTKTVNGILGFTPQGLSTVGSLSEIAGTILFFNNTLNNAVRSMETIPLNISPHDLISTLKIHLLKYIHEGQRTTFDDIKGPLGEVLETINQIVPNIIKIPQENQNIIFLNQYLSILDEFDKYLSIYPSLIERNEEFFDSLFKLFALIAGASLAQYFFTESATQDALDNYVISLDSLLCRGV